MPGISNIAIGRRVQFSPNTYVDHLEACEFQDLIFPYSTRSNKFFRNVERFYSDAFRILYECRPLLDTLSNNSCEYFCVDFIGFRHEIACFKEFWEAKSDLTFNEMVAQGTEAGARVFATQMTILYESFEQDFEKLKAFVERCREYGSRIRSSPNYCVVRDGLLSTSVSRNFRSGTSLNEHMRTVRCFYERQEQRKFVIEYLLPIISDLDHAMVEAGTSLAFPLHYPEIAREVDEVETQSVEKILEQIKNLLDIEGELDRVVEADELEASRRNQRARILEVQISNKYTQLRALQAEHHSLFPYACNFAADHTAPHTTLHYHNHPIDMGRTQRDVLRIPALSVRTIRTRARLLTDARTSPARPTNRQSARGSGGVRSSQSRMTQILQHSSSSQTRSPLPSSTPEEASRLDREWAAQSLEERLESLYRQSDFERASNIINRSEDHASEHSMRQNGHRRSRYQTYRSDGTSLSSPLDLPRRNLAHDSRISQLPTPAATPSPPASAPVLPAPTLPSSSSSPSRPLLRIDTAVANRYRQTPDDTFVSDAVERRRMVLPPYYPISALPAAQQEVYRREGYTQLREQQPRLPQAPPLPSTPSPSPSQSQQQSFWNISPEPNQQRNEQQDNQYFQNFPMQPWNQQQIERREAEREEDESSSSSSLSSLFERTAMVGRRMTQRDIRQTGGINLVGSATTEAVQQQQGVIRIGITGSVGNNMAERRITNRAGRESMIEVIEIEDVDNYAE